MRYAVDFEIDNKSYKILQQGNFNSKSKKEAIYEIMNYAKRFSQDYLNFKDVNSEKREMTIEISGLKNIKNQRDLIFNLIGYKSKFASKFEFNENSFKIKCFDLESLVLKKS